MKYSFIIPVYNRPEETAELLESLTHQHIKDFEVIVVEDGSARPSDKVCDRYKELGNLRLTYLVKENGGPGKARNYGVEKAQGEYVIILDSDVVLPDSYLQAVDDELRREPCDAFGGPDRADSSFTPTQKAISYSMTSFFTTGGIRGGKKKLDKFYPRSFNMGIRRSIYLQLGGFADMRFGEDIDFTIRIFKAGCSCRLFPGAWVYHKRRTDFRKFWRQVFNSGIARINLYKKYPESLKLVHLLPMLFTVGVALLMLGFLAGIALFFLLPSGMQQATGIAVSLLCLLPILLYAGIIFFDANIQCNSAKIGLLAIRAAFTQLIGYGCGFLTAWWRRCVKGQDEFSAYKKNFYK